MLAAGCLFLGAGAVWAVTPDSPPATADTEELATPANPYAVIVDKNIFRLNPPPPPPQAEPLKPADLPKYMLTGIVTIGDQTRALFALASKDAKEPPTYFNLLPSEKQGDLQLVSIDIKKREVSILNSGLAMTLSAASNSFAASGGGGGPAAEAPGARGRRLPGFPAPPQPPAPAPEPAAGSPATAANEGGAVIIGGNGSGNGGSEPEASGVVTGGGQSVGGNNFAAESSGGFASSGVSVAGGSPINYGSPGGVPGVGGVGVATPNGTVPISLGSGTQVNAAQIPNWPPVEANSAETSYLDWAAQAEGKNGAGGDSGVTVAGGGSGTSTLNGKQIPMPPLPPIPPAKGAGAH